MFLVFDPIAFRRSKLYRVLAILSAIGLNRHIVDPDRIKTDPKRAHTKQVKLSLNYNMELCIYRVAARKF